MTDNGRHGIDLNSVFAPGELVVEDFTADLVVWSIRQRSLHHLDLRAALIFDLVDGHRTVAEIVSALLKEFDVERASIVPDVVACLEQLVRVGIIDYVGRFPPEA